MHRRQLSLNEYHRVMIACEQKLAGLNVGYSTQVELTFGWPYEKGIKPLKDYLTWNNVLCFLLSVRYHTSNYNIQYKILEVTRMSHPYTKD